MPQLPSCQYSVQAWVAGARMEHVAPVCQDQKPRTVDAHPRQPKSSVEYRGADSHTARVVLWYGRTKDCRAHACCANSQFRPSAGPKCKDSQCPLSIQYVSHPLRRSRPRRPQQQRHTPFRPSYSARMGQRSASLISIAPPGGGPWRPRSLRSCSLLSATAQHCNYRRAH